MVVAPGIAQSQKLSDVKHYEFYILNAQRVTHEPIATDFLGANESEAAF